MLLPTVQMEVSAGPASLGQAQQKICRFEQSHTQKDFFWQQQQLFSFLVKKRITPGTEFLPQSVLFLNFKEVNLSLHKGTEKFQGQPRD